ncbi:formylglycine-generating enzyme required for sulfatase activity [Nitrosospira sp. Nsp5]|uniref:Formylglycine-generating enzyme, required for sulfatase activity, contains SUMF1/FGE domain n=2 Tax=Nitrosospira TaxID=35798 RepID=A0ABY0TL40_9PROT|nr:SUMF1/EgtB/PvdO family nonheme iron enzyme [Nitrosospira multiformis]PTR05981.1 formylglycine-generating enzyme required for sulfatase activity [Nitrosospira sp. Nsp5]SDQ91602.1 Formylglycine-generating enzyme, required for sulfatase activity, contains SUMF1/FGE domain [Nitrosospira multiformis]
MKSICYTCLLVLIFTGSAEARSFASTLPSEREAGILNAKMPTEIAKLQASEKIDASNGMALEEALEIGDTSFQRVESQRVAQLDKGTKRHDSERLPAGDKKQAEENKACTDCPELISIPGYKFAIGKFAVTFEEWDACVADGGCGGYQPPDNGWGRGNRPVINVNWNDAQTYIQWLSDKSGKAYRLPSAEEWEIAARAGTTTEYYWGDDVGRNHANCDGCGSEWDNRRTAPVGSFKPNAFGLYDMMGNVWQWTDTCWQGNCAKRLFFGGSWNHRPQDMRATTRNWFDTTKRMRYLGFRLAMTTP